MLNGEVLQFFVKIQVHENHAVEYLLNNIYLFFFSHPPAEQESLQLCNYSAVSFYSILPKICITYSSYQLNLLLIYTNSSFILVYFPIPKLKNPFIKVEVMSHKNITQISFDIFQRIFKDLLSNFSRVI